MATSHFDHAVQFYEGETFLCHRITDFVAAGIEGGDPVVIIAVDRHLEAVAAGLTDRGCDLDRVTFIDAHEALTWFMADSMPDGRKFHAKIGGALRERAGSGRVRAYGEMVHVLWTDGKRDAALQLEKLWNDLAATVDLSLLCAYPISNFGGDDAVALREICRAHRRVLPAESYHSGAEGEQRNRDIVMLQQRAAALEREIEHRRKLERDLHDFLENAIVGMHWVSSDGTILWANMAELTLLGYERDEYVGLNIRDIHADRDVIEDILARLTRRQSIYDYEARLLAKDGSIRHVAITSNAYIDEQGRFVHTRCFTRDITDRKRLDDERRHAAEINAFLLDASSRLNRSLDYESRLREITDLIVPRLADACSIDVDETTPMDLEPSIREDGAAMLLPLRLPDRVLGTITLRSNAAGRYTEEDLPLASELVRRAAVAIENARLYTLAQTANRTKDEFLATLSHELRTPLTAVLGWARMLLLGGLDDQTRRIAFETIEKSARTQATLIDDLLDLSRIVTGKLTLQNELVDLATAVENSVQTQQLAADAKGIRLVVELPPQRTIVNGDPTRLQQIVWNLLSNAIKFSSSGGTVTLVLERDDDAARIIVRDEGRGISPQFLPHVFEPFRQGDPASTRRHGGLGLGLAIVKYLTELHGGSVIASSPGEDRGATFVVTLPLAIRLQAVS